MLPTEDKTNICIAGDKLAYIVKSNYNLSHIKSQHLYIIADEEIKQGDWVYKKDVKGFVYKHKPTTNPWYNDEVKIIATTNKKIKNQMLLDGFDKIYPQIPQLFLKLYCEQGGIDEVELEYSYTTHKEWRENGKNHHPLKLTPNNEVIVKPVKERMYTKEEVETLTYDAMKSRNYTPLIDHRNWIKENL